MEIFASEGAPPVSTTPVANFSQASTTRTAKKFALGVNYTGWVSDPHRFNADPDTNPDPAFCSNCESGFWIRIPDPDPGFDDLNLKKIYSRKFNFYFLDQKLQFTYP